MGQAFFDTLWCHVPANSIKFYIFQQVYKVLYATCRPIKKKKKYMPVYKLSVSEALRC